MAKSSKKIEKSKSQLKIEATIESLEALQQERTLTTYELQRLANARYKLDSRSASKVFKEVIELPEAKEMLGKAKQPTFKQFCAELPNKPLYSVWDGLRVLAKFNKAAAIAQKVKKQGGVSGKKAEKVGAKEALAA